MKLYEAVSVAAQLELNTKEEAKLFLDIMKEYYNSPTYNDILINLNNSQIRLMYALETGSNLDKAVIKELVDTIQRGRKDMNKIIKCLGMLK